MKKPYSDNLRDCQPLYQYVMNAAAPEGTPPRQIYKCRSKNVHNPPCLEEALMRVTLIL